MAIKMDYKATIMEGDGFVKEYTLPAFSLIEFLINLYNIVGNKLVKNIDLFQPTLLNTIKEPIVLPAAVSDLAETALSATDTTLTFNHSAISGVVWYEYEFALSAGNTLDNLVSAVYTDPTAITVTGLTAATAYDIKVRAINYAGASAWCAAVSATTAAE